MHMRRSNKMKSPTVSKLKKDLWQLTRKIIINRHGTDCYCCGAPGLSGSNLHVGHFIPSSVCSAEVRYLLDNLRPSCYRCNIHLSGNWIAFEAHLVRDGFDITKLKQRNQDTKGLLYDRHWYIAKIEEYRTLLAHEHETNPLLILR